MSRLDALRGDLAVIRRFLRGMPREGDHAQRLAGFYGEQAEHYDRFRERLLPGRAELIGSLDLPQGARIVELGGGTGRNLEYFPEARRADLQFELVDLCEPLLEIARRRTRSWPQVRITCADATCYQPAQAADIVLLSYALTMIPDWRAALDNALVMLRPGGQLAVVDFHVSSADPAPDRQRHDAFTRLFWPRWFRHDGVHLNPAHLDTLCTHLPWHRLHEGRARLPWLPGLRVPYYRFVGRRRG